jgi:gamma-glutamylcyclotransferase (GGCT)/AIG2-like uncharacterized protein YtfP
MLVAVYGTLKQGHGNHAHFLNKAPIAGDQLGGFKMYSLGGFPACQHTGDNNDRVMVEVYEIDDKELYSLDGLEGYPDFYNRMEVDTCMGKAWIYNMQEPPVTAPLVEGGCW